jgi:hypothetical protein
MAKRSTVERLPEGARKQLEEWLVEFNGGRIPLDEVMTRLESLLEFNGATAKPSRSAVHRHAQKFAALGERMKRSQAFADAFAREVGPQLAEGKGMQVLLQAFQSLAFDMLGNLDEGASLDPESLMFFARAIQSAAGAQKTDADRAARIAEQARKEAAATAGKEAKAAGLSEEKVKQIERAILGVDT